MIRAREKKREGLGDEESEVFLGGERQRGGKGRENASVSECLRFIHGATSLFMAQPCVVVRGATVRHVYPFHYTLRIFINANLKNLQGQNIKVGSIN